MGSVLGRLRLFLLIMRSPGRYGLEASLIGQEVPPYEEIHRVYSSSFNSVWDS
jgi:hypothetical protein